jgi:hypothetical protein
MDSSPDRKDETQPAQRHENHGESGVDWQLLEAGNILLDKLRLMDAKDIALILTSTALVMVGIFQTAATVRSADAAKKAAQIAASQMEITDRPWITIDASIISPLTYDGKAARVAFSFAPKNIGHSPAQNVLIMPELVPAFMGDDVREEQKRICDGAAQMNSAFPKYVLFPEEPFQEPFRLDLPTEVINSRWSEIQPRSMKIPDLIPIVLLGCVDYTYETSPRHHQTGFAFDIIMKDGRLPLKSLVPLNPDSLALRRHVIFGGQFAN